MIPKISHNNLILDDERSQLEVQRVNPNFPYPPCHIVRSYQEFKDYILRNGIPDFISFDHDLGSDPETGNILPSGYDAAKWLVNHIQTNNLYKPLSVQVHSMNPIGRKNILNLLKSIEF